MRHCFSPRVGPYYRAGIVLGAVDPVRCRGHCRWVDSSTSRIAMGLVASVAELRSSFLRPGSGIRWPTEIRAAL